MNGLKPWARGPFELILHAEGHLKGGSDFDKRIAIVSYDNAIEVAITTFLRLHPSQRGGQAFQRDKVDHWLSNYHTKLEFLFEEYSKTLEQPLPVTHDEVVWYHNLRNELYHSGNGMVPEQESLVGARKAALCVFSTLFKVNAEQLMQRQSEIRVPRAKKDRDTLPAQMRFLQAFIELEKTLVSTLHALEGSDNRKVQPKGFTKYWNAFAAHCKEIPGEYTQLVFQANKARNMLVHGQSTSLTERQLIDLVSGLEKVSKFVGRYAFSFDILFQLKDRYPRWVRPDIKSVRVIQWSGKVFLEIVAKKGTGLDEEISRTELGFIRHDADHPMFSPRKTAYENAQLLLQKLDPYSIINCTDLFTTEGAEEVARRYGPFEE